MQGTTDLAKKGEFVPSEKQKIYLFQMIRSGFKKHPGLSRFGIIPADIDEWKKDDGFIEWIHRGVCKWLCEDLVRVYTALLKKAITGSVPAIELYLKRFDKEYQAFLGKIELSTRTQAPPVSPEEMARAVVQEFKVNPEFRKFLETELRAEKEHPPLDAPGWEKGTDKIDPIETITAETRV